MKKEEVVALPEGVSPEQVAAWKNAWGSKVRMASLPKDDDGNEFMDVIVRVPDRRTLSEFEKWIDKNPDKAKEIMINSCLLSHKDVVKADDGLFAGAYDAIAQLIPIRKAIIKNL